MAKNSTDQKVSSKSIWPEVVAASLLNKKIRKASFAAVAAKVVADEVLYNRQHYYDMLVFNFGNSLKSNKVYDKIYFSDLPEEPRAQVERLYSKFDTYTTTEIFKALGTVPTIRNNACPLEAKFAYEYQKKYKSFDYDPDSNKTVTDAEILRKLEPYEVPVYVRWF